MNAIAKLALILCLSCLSLLGQAQTASTAPPPDFTRAELDQMLAPIALYPDTVLSHVLIASTYPLEVVQAARWATANSKLSAEAALSAVDNQDWDPSVKALVAFPQILQRMSDDLDWTQRVGDAFLADEAEVMDVIQDLRQKAYASGNLDKMEHVRVQREEKVIVIEPAVERVVYVPYYDTRVIYGDWWWPDYPPVYWHHPHHHTFVTGFYWGPRVVVAPAFFFSAFHWHNRRVVVVDHHHHHHHPRFHSSRHIVHYHGARHWHHNPVHRRGVVYRNDHVRQHYGSNRQSYRTLQEQRNYSRRHTAEGHNRPNSARTTTTVDRRNTGTPPPRTHWRGQSDADRVRERLQERRDAAGDGKHVQRTGPNTSKTGPRDLTEHHRTERLNRDERRDSTVQRSGEHREQRRDTPRNQDSVRQTWRENQQRPEQTQPPKQVQHERRQSAPDTRRDERPSRTEVIRRAESQPQRNYRQNEQPRFDQRRIEQNRPQQRIERTSRPTGHSGGRESRRIER